MPKRGDSRHRPHSARAADGCLGFRIVCTSQDRRNRFAPSSMHIIGGHGAISSSDCPWFARCPLARRRYTRKIARRTRCPGHRSHVSTPLRYRSGRCGAHLFDRLGAHRAQPRVCDDDWATAERRTRCPRFQNRLRRSASHWMHAPAPIALRKNRKTARRNVAIGDYRRNSPYARCWMRRESASGQGIGVSTSRHGIAR